MATEFEILDGMPAHGPYPEQFSATGRGTHREGLVLRVRPPHAEAWVGNFQRGLTSYDVVHLHPNSRDLVVVAGGEGYIVEPSSRRLIATFGGQICWSRSFVEHRLLLFHNGLWFDAHGSSGPLWQTRRLSFDGIRVRSIEWPWLRGEAWTFDGDRWEPFAVDLRSGEASGGTYCFPE